MASPSAWTAKAHGVTMSLSSGFGGRSNTRRYISEPTTRCPRPGLPSADTSASTTAEDHIRALTGRRPIRPTSPRCRMSRRLNPGRSSTYQTEEAVQTSGASTLRDCRLVKLPEHRPSYCIHLRAASLSGPAGRALRRKNLNFAHRLISDFVIHVMTSWPRLGDKATNVTLPTIAGNRLHGMERAKGIEPSYA